MTGRFAWLGRLAKAVFAFVGAFVNGLAGALVSGESLGSVDAKTWLVVLALALGTAGGVYGITNAVSGEKQDSGPT